MGQKDSELEESCFLILSYINKVCEQGNRNCPKKNYTIFVDIAQVPDVSQYPSCEWKCAMGIKFLSHHFPNGFQFSFTVIISTHDRHLLLSLALECFFDF